ncbi:GyrI-like domain-containing protein [Demequina globuliformis]|uniref:GyrI-like domain-containing protein n=1 Tax=Demequina globuliformis TaxID=676202 RepID=UPI0007822713|nr:GyrI-like domain-containing protein [Demequina globuliformis]
MTTATEKWDAKKSIPSYRARPGRVDLITLPSQRYLAADAAGAPEAELRVPESSLPMFSEAVQALYPLAYALKFASKNVLGRDYVVPPLEALWWADDMSVFTTPSNRDRWRSTALLMIPAWIEEPQIESAFETASGKVAPELLSHVRVETLTENVAAQTLHVGPFSEEGPVVESLHAHIADAGMELAGKHHEVYLSDVRRAAPDKWRTIIRQPAR